MEEEPKKKKKNRITIKNKGIVISDNPISTLSNVKLTTVRTPTPHDNTVSEPTNINLDHTPTENHVSEQSIQTLQQHTSPEKQNPIEQQQHKTSEPPKSPSHIQTSQQNISESIAAEENAVSGSTEKVISEATEPLPETSPVFDDFSKTDFFSGTSADEIPFSSNQTTENLSQLVSVLIDNPTPLKTLVDLTLTSDKEDDTVLVSNSMSKRKRSENRFVVPPKYFPKRTVVDKMLNKFECDLKNWLTILKKDCSDSYDPVEANQLFTSFRKKINTAASAIHDVACQSAMKNLQSKINKRILYLDEKPAYESYTAFAYRLAAAKAVEEKARLEATEMDLEIGLNSEVAEMDIDIQQSAEVVVAADKELTNAEPEASANLKAWMAK